MSFDSLLIKTSGSHLKGQLEFYYERKDFADFLNKVKVDAEFEESALAFDEINMLYNQFGSGKEVNFSTRVSGVLNNLNTENSFFNLIIRV
ncbi:hypothetical protein Q2T40_04060 [Winogradskyella maritima]|nr:hypothetical protein [Winogradskyella maritima]